MKKIAAIMVLGVALAGCSHSSSPYHNRIAKGAVVGGGIGAVAGGVATGNLGGAAVGAGVGALVGGTVAAVTAPRYQPYEPVYKY